MRSTKRGHSKPLNLPTTGKRAVACVRNHWLIALCRYLAVLAQQCFLHARVIMRAFEHVFAVCIRFCALIESGSKLDDEVARQVMGIRNDFQRESCFLFSVLSSKTGQYSAPHLSQVRTAVHIPTRLSHVLPDQLVLRVNFNGYFSGQVARIGLTK